MFSSRFLHAIMAMLPSFGFGQAIPQYNTCESLATSFTHPNVTINFVSQVAAGTTLQFDQSGDLALCGVPFQTVDVDLCRVAMYVSTTNRSGITLEAWLPTNWTGRFLSSGNGGIGGCIQYRDLAYGTSLGFASVGANNGHNGTNGNAFYQNEDVVIDFAWRSLVTETLVGKALAKAYYGEDLTKSYYLGCSTGGRQGFKMAQDFPELFDGILAGAPALAFNNLTSWSGHFYTFMGNTTSDTYLTPALWGVVHKDILKQCDSLDGVVDGIIEDSSICYYKPVTLQCAHNATDTSSCLTAPQVRTVEAVFSDYYGENGALIYPRMQPGSESVASSFEYTGAPFPYTTDWYRYAVLQDPTWDPATLNSTYAALAARLNPGNVETWNGDLSPFQARGGKLIHYHGQMDGIITSANSPRYYTHVATTMGLAPSELDSFYRFFRIGGMDHCYFGDGAWYIGHQPTPGQAANITNDPQYNILLRMVDWVEKGATAAPETVTGLKYVNNTVSLGIDIERQHCRYPLRNFCVDPANYKKKESWTCIE